MAGVKAQALIGERWKNRGNCSIKLMKLRTITDFCMYSSASDIEVESDMVCVKVSREMWKHSIGGNLCSKVTIGVITQKWQ